MSVRRVVPFVIVLVLAAACAPTPTPPPGPLLTCTGVGGTLLYSPPAANSGADVTVSAAPDVTITGCTDPAGSITGGAVTSGSILLPGLDCSTLPTVGTEWGAGSGRFTWSTGATSDWEVRLLGDARTTGFSLEFRFTAGKFAGAVGSLLLRAVTSDGDCSPGNPLTTATVEATAPLVVHRAPSTGAPELTGVTEVSGGYGTACAVRADTTVVCWGDNSGGQLGNILSAPGATSYVPRPVTGLTGVTRVALAQDSACAVRSNGTVACWGRNTFGKLGDGTTTDRSLPTDVVGLTDAVDVVAGNYTVCALRAAGKVSCWGAGPLGDGSTGASPVPVEVPGLAGVTQLTGGSSHRCAVLGDQTVTCWGGNAWGQLGDGTTTDRLVPTPVPGLSGVAQVAGGGEHTCALRTGDVSCWGFNRYGQLGSPAGEFTVTSPTPVPRMGGATALTAGGANTCALVAGDRVACWGANEQGNLGAGTTSWSELPTPVLGLTGVTALQDDAACAIVDGGRVRCWGGNPGLGTGTTEYFSSVPRAVVAALPT